MVLKIEYSKETLLLASMCWSGDEIRSTSARIGTTYERDGITYKIELKTLSELYEYQKKAEKKFKITRFVGEKSDVINLIGVNE